VRERDTRKKRKNDIISHTKEDIVHLQALALKEVRIMSKPMIKEMLVPVFLKGSMRNNKIRKID
jgi:hypothetical protein